MSFLDKLQVELNRAGRAAQDAIDEGRLRIEIFRVRQLADKAAQALGYAVYRAKVKGEELDAAAWDLLSATLKEHEAEAARLDAELTRVRENAPAAEAPPAGDTPAAAPTAGEQAPPSGPDSAAGNPL